MTPQQKRIILFGRSAGGVDPSAAAFLTAAGITDATITNAIDRLVKNYKGQGNLNNSVDLWTGSSAIYPFVGGNATAHKFNLKDPRDLDAAFRLNFSGGWTHNANGITGNNTNTFANTFLKPSDLAQNSHRNIAYLRTDNGSTNFGSIAGATNAGFANGFSFEISKNSGNHASYSNTSFQIIANANRTGLIGISRIASNQFKVYRNGNASYTVSANSLTPISLNMYIGAQNNNGGLVSVLNENIALSVIGAGLSDDNMLLEYQIIQQFQQDLARNV